MFNKIFKSFLRLFFTVKFFEFRKARSNYSKHSRNVVLIYPDKWKNLLQYLYSDAIVSDLALIQAVSFLKEDYKIKFGLKNMSSIVDSQVFYNISGRFNISGYRNYTNSILQFLDHMTTQGNVSFPAKRDVNFWENKVFMHLEFERLGIKCPQTYIYDLHQKEELPNISFPFLIKEVHSKGAEGIYKVNSIEEVNTIVNDTSVKKRNSHLLFQRLLDIDRDIRVVCIGDKIAYHHWRFNDKNKEWEPTTYKSGKAGDFGNFPEKWRSYIIEQFLKLEITTGGFDLAWENNDYNNSPYVLEVSSSYFPNPEPPEDITIPYGTYKHKFKLFNSWEKHYVLQTRKIKMKVVKENTKTNKK